MERPATNTATIGDKTQVELEKPTHCARSTDFFDTIYLEDCAKALERASLKEKIPAADPEIPPNSAVRVDAFGPELLAFFDKNPVVALD